jgi:hypothetical protein
VTKVMGNEYKISIEPNITSVANTMPVVNPNGEKLTENTAAFNTITESNPDKKGNIQEIFPDAIKK